MALDRSKFKATSVAKNAEADREVNKTLGRGSRKVDTLEITEGRNKFRLYPIHPEGGGDVFAEAVARVFLPVVVEVKDDNGNVEKDNRGEAKTKIIQKPIFNSKVHGDAPKDLVEEYISIGKSIAEEIDDKGQKADFLAKLYGKYNPKATAENRLSGCNYKQTWVMYAHKIEGEKKTFGRLEVGKMVRESMNRIAAEEGSDDPLAVDPFTDPDLGLPVNITYNKPQAGEKSNPSTVYTVTIDKNYDKASDKLIRHPLTDAELENWEKFPPLAKLFRNVFTKKDFAYQIEGLKNFDDKYELGICETPEFNEVVDELTIYFEDNLPDVAENTSEEDENSTEATDTKKDQFDLMSRIELKNFNTLNKLGIVPKASITDDEFRNEVRARLAERAELVQRPLPGDKEFKEEKTEVKKEVSKTTETASERIARLRSNKKP